jgi:hypothetical protein
MKQLWDSNQRANILSCWNSRGTWDFQRGRRFILRNNSRKAKTKKTNIQVQKGQRSSIRPLPRYIIIEISKVKDKKNLKAGREKKHISMSQFASLYFSTKTLQSGDSNMKISVLKEKKTQIC